MLKLKKDTILYHTTDEEFTYRPNKQMLFLTFQSKGYFSFYFSRVYIF